jgi:hypothetical protein
MKGGIPKKKNKKKRRILTLAREEKCRDIPGNLYCYVEDLG